MKSTIYRRRSTTSKEGAMFKKDNQPEHAFFGESSKETFFKPATVAAPAQSIQRKCADCEKEDKKMQRMTDKKEEEKKLQRATDKKEEEKKLQRMGDKKEEEKKLQKKEAGASNTGTVNTSAYIGSLNGKGNYLPKQANQFFSARMGYDFSGVKIHNDKAAADSAKDVNAKAYTIGNNIVFNEGQYNTESVEGKKLMAHELTHVIQQNSDASSKANRKTANQYVSKASNIIQRAGDPRRIPGGLTCPTSLATGAPAGTDLLFAQNGSTITGSHTLSLIGFAISWLLSGGYNNILIHGYASTEGTDEHNWALSCNRAEAVRAELIRLGIPPVRIRVVAHGESTDFGASLPPNRRVVVSTAGRSFFPLVFGTLTPQDNFAGRSTVRHGVGEVIDLDFFSFPSRPAADFGGLEWNLVSGGGTLVNNPGNNGTGTYTAPALASTVQLQLRIATGLLAGRVIATRTISVVQPNGIRLVPVTSPNFTGWGNPPLAPGTWGAGFTADVFILPRDVSFRGVVFGEGTVAPVITGSFLSVFSAAHPVNTFGPGLGGNAATGTPLGPARRDGVFSGGRGPAGSLFGTPTCGESTFLWAIPWEYIVAGAPRTPFAGGFRANHFASSTFFCQARISKAGGGPFCRNINGTVC